MKGGTNLVLGVILVSAAVGVTLLYLKPRSEAAELPSGTVGEEGARSVPAAEAIRERGLGEPVRKPWVVVRRGARQLWLYDGGTLVKRYRIAVGRRTGGDKEREGDKRTPLGSFYICTRNAKSRFHKFLGLSYPAPEDAERGRKQGLISRAQYRAILEAHRAGRQPPWKTKLGGEVGLHGGGAGRLGGTLGCVGMSDADIDELWAILRLGDPVLIEP